MFRDDARPGVKPGSTAGSSFLRAVSGGDSECAYDYTQTTQRANALLVAIVTAIETEGAVVKPARPTLVRALAILGGTRTDAEESESESAGNETNSFCAQANSREFGNVVEPSAATIREAELLATRALVESAVRGCGVCLGALDNTGGDIPLDLGTVNNGEDDETETQDDDGTSSDFTQPVDGPAEVISKLSMSSRRAVAHALLDALGPAARRNGCYGDPFVAPVRFVFRKCFGDSSDDDNAAKNAALKIYEHTSDDNAKSSTQKRSVHLKSGVCPRVAVRFAKTLKVTADSVLRKGQVKSLAESLCAAVEENFNSPQNNFEKRTSRSDSRFSCAGAVAELLVWSGEVDTLSMDSLLTVIDACVTTGHTSAAEMLTKASPFSKSLRGRLAKTHFDIGNYKVAKRLGREAVVSEVTRNDEYDAFHLASGVFEALGGGGEGDRGEGDQTAFGVNAHTEWTNLSNVFGSDIFENVLLVDDLASMKKAKFWMQSILSRQNYETPIIGFDCEWRPGPGDAATNPVTVAQFAAGIESFFSSENEFVSPCPEPTTSHHARAVVLDCVAVFGDGANAELAAHAQEFVAWVFARTLLCGFGVAGDVSRLVKSYPNRRFVNDSRITQHVQGLRDAFTNNSATCVCVREVALTLSGADKRDAGSLSRLTNAVLGQALDKEMQCSRWDLRPLTEAQLVYASLDALAPVFVLMTLLSTRKGGSSGETRDVAVLSKPWWRRETLDTNARDWRDASHARAALIGVGALGNEQEEEEEEEEEEKEECLRIENWDTSERDENVVLCKTLAVVGEFIFTGTKHETTEDEDAPPRVLSVLALAVLPVGDDSQCDFGKVGDFLSSIHGQETVKHVRLANDTELFDLFGFPKGSCGPFGCRPVRDRPRQVRIGPFPNPDTVCPYKTDTFLSQKKYAESVGQHKIEVIIDEALIRGDTRIAVGGGAPSVKITGATSVFVKFTDAAVASVTTSSVN